jgi:hypothetical protein
MWEQVTQSCFDAIVSFGNKLFKTLEAVANVINQLQTLFISQKYDVTCFEITTLDHAFCI